VPDRFPNARPNDLQEIATRNRLARHLAEEFSEQLSSDIWRTLAAAFSDVPALSAEVVQLRADLAGARLDRANLAAAALAAVAAHEEGEPDPLSYVRDELQAQGHDISRGRR
jgi:serine/threonine protein kinase HipA of HipAB toxin-antitoxin module